MTPLGWIVIGACIFLGVVIGYILFKYKDKKLRKVIKDPHLLVEKLKASGQIYDDGKELDIKVGIDDKTGKEVVIVEERESKKAKTTQKKLEKKTKKQIKKGAKKK